MKIKTTGLILLLVATTGFGFHKWLLDSRIDACATYIKARHDARGRYIDGLMRYRDSKREWQVELLTENIGQLFKRTDLLLYKEIRDASREGVSKARENIRATKRLTLLEFAYNVGDKAYAEDIDQRFDSIRSQEPDEVAFMTKLAADADELSDEIYERWEEKIATLQQEIERKQVEMTSYLRQRSGFYVLYLIVQIVGIALTILAESASSNSHANKTLEATS